MNAEGFKLFGGNFSYRAGKFQLFGGKLNHRISRSGFKSIAYRIVFLFLSLSFFILFIVCCWLLVVFFANLVFPISLWKYYWLYNLWLSFIVPRYCYCYWCESYCCCYSYLIYVEVLFCFFVILCFCYQWWWWCCCYYYRCCYRHYLCLDR